jgi:putative lipoprotein
MTKMLRYIVTIPLLAWAALVMSGTAHAQASDLAGATWTLTAIKRAGQPVQQITNATITLQFEPAGRAGGMSTCNGYSADYQAGGGKALTFGPILATKRACVDPALMQLEIDYFNALGGVTTYNADGTELELFFDNGQSRLAYSTDRVPGMPRTGGAAGLTLPLLLAAMGLPLLLLGVGLILRRQTRIKSNR